MDKQLQQATVLLPITSQKHQRGVGLIEILIAVIVLSMGIFGVAALQVKGIQINHSAYLRTEAVWLANEIIDRIRTNREGYTNGNYHVETPASYDGTGSFATCTNSPCTAATLAAYDISQWVNSIQNRLPAPPDESAFSITTECTDTYTETTTFSIDCTQPNAVRQRVSIVINWGNPDGTTSSSYTTAVELARSS